MLNGGERAQARRRPGELLGDAAFEPVPLHGRREPLRGRRLGGEKEHGRVRLRVEVVHDAEEPERVVGVADGDVLDEQRVEGGELAGEADLGAAALRAWDGAEANSFFGNALAVGDIDGDGVDDIVTSAPLVDSYRGEVYITLTGGWF